MKQTTPLNRSSDNKDVSNNNNNNNNINIIIDCHFVDCRVYIIKLVYGIPIQSSYFLGETDRNLTLKSHRSFKTYTIHRRFWRAQTFWLCRLNCRSFRRAANAYENCRASDNMFKLFGFCTFAGIWNSWQLHLFSTKHFSSNSITTDARYHIESSSFDVRFPVTGCIVHTYPSDRHTFPML